MFDSDKEYTLQELSAAMLDGTIFDEAEEEETKAEDPSSETPDGESPSEDGQSEEAVSEDEAEPEEDKETEEEAGEPEEAEQEPETAAAEGAAEDEVEAAPEPELFELPTGETVSKEDLLNGYLRQQDYTRKTQQLAEMRRGYDERVAAVESLVTDIAKDNAMKQFVSAHPEAMEFLIRQPEATRAMLGNESKVQEFWQEYEVIIDNPGLAKKFLESPEEAKPQIDTEAEVRQAIMTARAIEVKIEEVGQEYDGIDPYEVQKHFANLVGLTNGITPEQFAEGVSRLAPVMIGVDNGGNYYVKPELIKAEYERRAKYARLEKEIEQSKVEQHNTAVDQALTNDAPPATPSGAPPAPSKEDEWQPGSLREVLDKLGGM